MGPDNAVSISLYLLGPFEIRLGAGSTQPALERKTRALLGYLAATGSPHSRQSLLQLFCREADDPAGSLRWHLSRVRRQVDANILCTNRKSVQLDLERVWVDCHAVQHVLERESYDSDLDTLAGAVDVYRGDFLEGLALPDAPEFELWLLGERSRFRRLYERGLAALVSRLIAAGQYEAAIDRAQSLLQSDPLHEEAHLRLAWLYAQTGRREAALGQLDRCRDLLLRELGVEPAPEVRQLRDQIFHNNLQALEALAPRTAEPRSALTVPQATEPFVGRERELAQLQQARQTAMHQGGVVVLLEAEAGGGKTRLAQEFARHDPDALHLTGHCSESTHSMPYRPWIDLVQLRLAQLDNAALKHLSSYWLDQLALLLPELAARHSRIAAAPPSNEQEHLFTAVAEVLLQPAVTGSANSLLLLFVDDLQWADEASLRLFYFVAQRLQHQARRPAMLLGAFRSEEAADNPALLQLISDLQRTGALLRLALPPLAPSAVDDLIAHLWPELPPGYRSPHVRDALLQATGGNPLFVSEVLRELAQAERLPSSLPIPPSLRDLVQRRMRQLSGSGRQVLEALAILHEPATLDQARRVSGRSEDETDAAIELGLRWGLLQTTGSGLPLRINVRHDLIREAIVHHISGVRRQRLHQRAAAALTESGASPATLAYHWRLAGDTAREARYAALAGEAAAAVYASDEATRYFQRALELTDDQRRRAELSIMLADVWVLAGKWAEAEALYEEALATAKRIADLRMRARVQLQLGLLKFNQGMHAAALSLLEGAGETFEELLDDAGLCEALGGIGNIHYLHGRHARALDCFERRRQLGVALGDQLAVAKAVGSQGVVYMLLENHQRAVACLEDSLRIVTRLGHRPGIGAALGNLANVYQVGLYDYARAWDYRQQELGVWAEIGNPRGTAQAIGNMTLLYLDLGEYDHALACASRHLQACLALGERLGVTLALGRIAQVFAARGRFEEAERILQLELALGRDLRVPHFLCFSFAGAAKISLQQQRYAEAWRLNSEALELAREARRHEVAFSAQALSFRLQVALQIIDAQQAASALQALLTEELPEREQAALHYELAQLHPEPDQARRHAAAAAALYQRLHDQTHRVEYRRRYNKLTGTHLPAPPALPQPPAIVTAEPVDLAGLLKQVEHLLRDSAV